MEKILKLKHWQVFIILGTGYIVDIVLPETSFSMGNFTSLEIALAAGIISLFFFFSWVLTIGLYTNSLSANPYRFKKLILIFSIIFATVGYSALNVQRFAIENLKIPEWFMTFITPLALFGIFFSFHNVTKSLKSTEIGRKAKFKEYIIDAILLFAYPIGIWFIQPRLNKIVLQTESNEK